MIYSNTSATCKAVEELLKIPTHIRTPSKSTYLSYCGQSSSPDLAFTYANLSIRSTLSRRPRDSKRLSPFVFTGPIQKSITKGMEVHSLEFYKAPKPEAFATL
ncbi:hypothetical protein TNCV_1491721 [Trichonephila clavipes]|nr:hypothetical protein TNCV_1491721 [Trichonephila clavipes]